MDLSNKTIIITGSSSGIGEEAAIQLAQAGAKVCLIARRAEELQRIQKAIQAQSGQVFIYPADITDPAQLKTCVTLILAEHQKIDVLVNNAARSIRRPILESLDRLHDYERTMQINYFAAVNMTLHILPHLWNMAQDISSIFRPCQRKFPFLCFRPIWPVNPRLNLFPALCQWSLRTRELMSALCIFRWLEHRCLLKQQFINI